MNDVSNRQATENYKRWQSCQNYLSTKGLLDLIPKCVDFKEGKQWANVTEATRHIPRPVVNFTDMIIENKASNILGTPVHLNFKADNDAESTVKFTNFASYQLKEMEMDYYDMLRVINEYSKFLDWGECLHFDKCRLYKATDKCKNVSYLKVSSDKPICEEV